MSITIDGYAVRTAALDVLTTADFEAWEAEFVVACSTAVDLFAGPGGWDEGAKALGLSEGILGFEFEANAVATARAAGHARVYGDLAKVNPAFFKAPGLIASPPCQGFSPAGLGRGRQDFDHLLRALDMILGWLLARGAEERSFETSPEQAIAWLQERIADSKSALILEPLRWVIRMAERPRWVAFEQVKTCLPIWEAMAKVLRAMGYSVWTGIVHAEEFGVGQTRTRAVLLGSLDHDVTSGPAPTHLRYALRHKGNMDGMRKEAADKGLLPWVSMAEAINMGLTNRPSYTFSAGGVRGSHSGGEWGGRSVREALHEAVADGTWKPRAANEGTTEADMQWAYERPSVTMVASYRPDVAAAPKYRKAGDGPRQNAHGSISVTPAESGMIQSFPADYPWQGPETRQYQQSGNAVPPVMASALLRFVTTGA